MTRTLMLALVTLSLTIVGCGGGGGESTPPPAGATVTGRVVSAQGGSGIAGATVNVGGKTATTTAAGNYSVSDVATGHRRISVTASGYVQPGAAIYLDVAAGTNRAPTIAMAPDNLQPPAAPNL